MSAAEARVQRAAEVGTDTVPMDVVDLPTTHWVDVSWALTLAEPTG